MNTKKFFLPILAIAFAFSFTACKKDRFPCVKASGEITTETRTVEAWTDVELSIGANLHITQDPNASEHTVRITTSANVHEFLKTEVNGNTLEIFTKRCMRKLDQVDIYLTVRDIDLVHVSGSGTVTTSRAIETDQFELKISGSADVDIEANVSTLTTRISGSGSVAVAGTAPTHNAKISGSGDIKCYGLTTSSTDINISGSGTARVFAEERLEVKISGSGDVYYRGLPSVNTNISGSGDIHSDN